MVIESAMHVQQPAFAPGTVVKNRKRLWRVDGQEDDVLGATAIDTGEPEQLKFYIPFEDIRPGRLEPPSPDVIGHPAAQDLPLPDEAQKVLYDGDEPVAIAAFFFVPRIVLFVDGSPHHRAHELDKRNPSFAANLAVAYHYNGMYEQRDEMTAEAERLGYEDIDFLQMLYEGEWTLRE